MLVMDMAALMADMIAMIAAAMEARLNEKFCANEVSRLKDELQLARLKDICGNSGGPGKS
jgi:Tfp pilus assembly protein FimT